MDSPRRLRLPDIPPNLGTSFLFGALVAVLNISDVSLRVGPGLDPSWNAALHVAAFRHMQFGEDLVFNYGPLGFLQQSQLYYPWTVAAGHLFVVAVQLFASTVLIQIVRRHLPLAATVAAAFLIARVDHRLDAGLLITSTVFVVCVTLLRSEDGLKRRSWIVVLASAIGGVQLLIKFNQGISTLAIVAIVCLASLRNRRLLGGAAIAGPAALVLGWLVTDNRLNELPGWIAASLQIAAGYSEAMGIRSLKVSLELVSAVVLFVALIWLAAWAIRDLRGIRRAAIWAVLASYVFFAFKQGFVRDNPVQFAAYLMIGLCAFLEAGKPRYLFGAALAFPFVGLLFVSPGNFLGSSTRSRRWSLRAPRQRSWRRRGTLRLPRREPGDPRDLLRPGAGDAGAAGRALVPRLPLGGCCGVGLPGPGVGPAAGVPGVHRLPAASRQPQRRSSAIGQGAGTDPARA